MQILGKRSKILLIAVAIVMLVAIGVSFAAWDITAVKATNGDLSSYANAKVGDKIKFGNYYQDGTKTGDKYDKQAITWIVVDKDERTGQLTLLSEKILAAGSYFGNAYKNLRGNTIEYARNTGVSYNQAYVDSTVRAYLNNLERLDLGGDAFESGKGYVPSAKASTYDKTDDNGVFTQGTGLLSSVGFSNQRYYTGLSYTTAEDAALVSKNIGLVKRSDSDQIYYQRPITNAEYINRPATIGFLSEAFDDEERAMIVPKQIAGYTGHRWPDSVHDVSTKSYVEGVVDKVWLPSATELNVKNGQDWATQSNDAWTNSSDDVGSTVFEYFANLSGNDLTNALKATRTTFAKNSFAMNYSIPVYNQKTTIVNTDIDATRNSDDIYWTRSPMSYWCYSIRLVNSSGLFSTGNTYSSNFGVRPCVILKY